MKVLDIFRLAIQNLFRRKSRTILTMIGVAIGCTSIVVMISIGSGLNESMAVSLESMGDLTTINVYNYSSTGKEAALNEEALASMETIDHVLLVAGKMNLDNYNVSIETSNGRYKSSWASIYGIDSCYLEALGYQTQNGDLDLSGAGSSPSSIPVLFGQMTVYNFQDTLRPDGYNIIDPYPDDYWDSVNSGTDETEIELNEPYFNPMDTKLTLKAGTYDQDEATLQSFDISCAGVLKSDNTNYESSYGIIMDLEQMKSLKSKISKTSASSTSSAPGASKSQTYDEVIIKADSINNVTDIEKSIKELGFMTSSMASIRESMQQQSRMIQLILGGIGAVALLVAAIGITNTMYMSISERTREIGIMKALGCKSKDILLLFLSEAGSIGLMGGILGVIFSYLISLGINYVSWQSLGSASTFWQSLFTLGSRASVIPIWLVLFGMSFSIFIGLLAGLMPARKAVKISALEAIRHE